MSEFFAGHQAEIHFTQYRVDYHRTFRYNVGHYFHGRQQPVFQPTYTTQLAQGHSFGCFPTGSNSGQNSGNDPRLMFNLVSLLVSALGGGDMGMLPGADLGGLLDSSDLSDRLFAGDPAGAASQSVPELPNLFGMMDALLGDDDARSPHSPACFHHQEREDFGAHFRSQAATQTVWDQVIPAFTSALAGVN